MYLNPREEINNLKGERSRALAVLYVKSLGSSIVKFVGEMLLTNDMHKSNYLEMENLSIVKS